MTQHIGASTPAVSFDYELYEGDPENLRTVVATPTQISPFIDPAALKLKHRIGRGPFGDVWLATHHQSGADFDEYHEVAVKILHPIKEDHMQKFLNRLEELFPKLRTNSGVCWLHGISIISGKVCIVMKFYEGSVGDQMAKLKGGKLPLPDVLRHGIDLAKGIQALHLTGVLVLNLKPSNFLLNERNQVILGDFGIAHQLLGISLPNSDLALRLGTPKYMSPEQWEPEVRGPITFETDTWGFGCSIVEMMTGVQPWFGLSIDEIYNSVAVKQEKPQIPNGLPPAVETIIYGCFEYDLRNRPLMEDIIHAFESSQKGINNDGEWIGLGSRNFVEKSDSRDGYYYSSWFLSKDHFQVGDTVRSRKMPSPKSVDVPEGTVVGLGDANRNEFVLVRIRGMHNPQRVKVSNLERVTFGLAVGDWVRRRIEENNHHSSSVGILFSIQRDGTAAAGFVGLQTLWRGHCSELQMSDTYSIGQFVRVKENIFSPRFDWPQKRATGKILRILPNGCLVVRFPGRLLVVLGDGSKIYLADPSQVETVSFDSCPGMVGKYRHVEDFHWAVRPLAITIGFLAALKLGLFVGANVKWRLNKGRKNQLQGEGNTQRRGNSSWFPPPVANILFREGPPPSAAATR